MFKQILTVAAIGLGALALSSCETISEEQCLAGDWIGRGYQDGQAGRPGSRLNDYAEACAEHSVMPDPVAYEEGRLEGLRQYCVPVVGYRVGRDGGSYSNVCTGAAEADFLVGFQDGRVVHDAQQVATSARSDVSSMSARLTELDDKVDYFQARARDTALSEEEREAAGDRVNELRRERRDLERDWRRAQEVLDEAERDARDALLYFRSRYGD
jgi:hypothetical protein